jgi:prepilin-type N-terminal cleavage/methylation domain-containing protein
MAVRQVGFTIIELTVVMAILGIMIAFMVPVITEPIFHAKIEGAVSEAKAVVSACNVARVSPVTTSRDATTKFVAATYGSNYTNWTDVSVLNSRLSAFFYVPSVNPFGYPYYFKMTSTTCVAAVQLDDLIDGWQGYVTEVYAGKTWIVVSLPASRMVGPAWTKHQKRLLSNESIR